MPDDRAASEAARRKKASARRVAPPATRNAPTPETVRRVTVLRIVGWAAYLVAIVLFVVFIVESIGGNVPTSQQFYPIPGVATVFLIVGIWSTLATVLWNSRSTATRVGKYIVAVLVTIIVYPLLVTILSDVASWLVSLDPGRVH
jgi:magnesium-transporting ATPase (P-type)